MVLYKRVFMEKDFYPSPKIKVLVAKMGLDGHDRGALLLCKVLKKEGFDVIYTGLFATPEKVVNIALKERVNVVAMSLLDGSHMELFPRVAKLLKEKNSNIALVGGGIIPEQDKIKLSEVYGITGNFGPGTPLRKIVEHIKSRALEKL